jgi:hypothetical protein
VERPRGDSPRPRAESELDTVNRCVVFPGAASEGASIDRNLRDANDRSWPAEPAPTLLATEATTVVTTARADDQMPESADSNARGRPVDGAGQDARAGGLSASSTLTGAPRPFGRRHASRVGWPAAAPTSTIIIGRHIGEAQARTFELRAAISLAELWREQRASGCSARRASATLRMVHGRSRLRRFPSRKGGARLIALERGHQRRLGIVSK